MRCVVKWLRARFAAAWILSVCFGIAIAPALVRAAIVWGNPAGDYAVGLSGPGVVSAYVPIDTLDWEACDSSAVWVQDVSGTVQLVAGLQPEPTDERCGVTVYWDAFSVTGTNGSGSFTLSVASGSAWMTPSDPAVAIDYTVATGDFDDVVEIRVEDLR